MKSVSAEDEESERRGGVGIPLDNRSVIYFLEGIRQASIHLIIFCTFMILSICILEKVLFESLKVLVLNV